MAPDRVGRDTAAPAQVGRARAKRAARSDESNGLIVGARGPNTQMGKLPPGLAFSMLVACELAGEGL